MRSIRLLLPLLVLVILVAVRLGDREGAAGLAPGGMDSASEPIDPGQLPPPDAPAEPDDPAAEREVVPPPTGMATEPDDPEAEEEYYGSDELLVLYPDPVELGECSLFIEVFDRTTQRPVATMVHLWRLEAPGNEYWKAGSQQQANVDVGVDGAWVRELPAGRYRARCLAERRANEDPVEFTVSGASTRQRLYIDKPRERELSLRLYTADGGLIREAEFQFGARGANTHEPGRPEWATERRPKFDSPGYIYGSGGAWSGSGRRQWTRLQADEEGWFHPGSIEEGNRHRTSTYRLTARFGELAHLSYYFDGDIEETRLVSVLVDPHEAQRSVLAPDGRYSDELEEGMRVTSGVVPYRPGAVKQWREAPIEVSRRWKKDYEDLEFEYTLDELPLPVRMLEPKEQE